MQKRMDWYGTEALVRLVSAEINVPMLQPLPLYRVKNDKISWKVYGRLNNEKVLFTGILDRHIWLEKRKSLIRYGKDYYPTGFYDF